MSDPFRASKWRDRRPTRAIDVTKPGAIRATDPNGWGRHLNGAWLAIYLIAATLLINGIEGRAVCARPANLADCIFGRGAQDMA
jgi:hypothetical protein